MTENRRPVDVRMQLLYDRAVLVRKIARYDTDLRNVHWIFLAGVSVMLIGVFVLWLVVANVTLPTFRGMRFVLDPISFGIAGAFFAIAGFALSAASVYVRIFYPSKLRKLRESLEDLDDLITYQKVFPPKLQEVLGKKHHVHYEDYVKKMKKVKSLESGRRFLESYGLPLCFIAAAVIVTIQGSLQGYPSEAISVGMFFTTASTIWIFWKYRKNRDAKSS